MKEFIEKLIGRLEEYQGKVTLRCGNRGDFDFMEVEAVKQIVNQLAEEYKEINIPTIDAGELLGNGWIPCSERLPEVEADVLLSLRSLDVYTGFRANTEGCFYVEGEGYVEFENVLAWKPLPAPYQPKGE